MVRTFNAAKLFLLVLGASLVLLLLAYLFLSKLYEPVITTVSVTKSSQGLEAVLFKRDVDVTVDTAYCIAIREIGSHETQNPVFIGDHVDFPEDFKISWTAQSLYVTLPEGVKVHRQFAYYGVDGNQLAIMYSYRKRKRKLQSIRLTGSAAPNSLLDIELSK